MSGRSAYYVELIAKHGLVAIHTASSSRLVAPPGGIRPMLGTNPIAIAVPSTRGPIVLDMGTSAYMMTELMLRERLGERLPEGSRSDPPASRRGIRPWRARARCCRSEATKASGWRSWCKRWAYLQARATDGESDYGYLFIAFRPDLLGPADLFERRVTQLIETVKATPRQADVEEDPHTLRARLSDARALAAARV